MAAVTFKAPAHLKICFSHKHLLNYTFSIGLALKRDLTVTFGAIYVRSNVSTVVEINKIGKVVNLFPRDRFLLVV